MYSFLRYALATSSLLALSLRASPLDKPTYHNDAARSGWNPHEDQLTSATVSRATFGQLWQTPQFDSVEGRAPRLFATPLYVDQVVMAAGQYRGGTYSVIYAASDVGYVYAVNATAAGEVPAGAILWRRRLWETMPGGFGAISTPTIDLARQRIYTVCAEGTKFHRVHALDLRSGEEVTGWPVTLAAAAVNAPGVNRNGTHQFRNSLLIQRGALNLNPDGSRLYVTFGADSLAGWIMGVDTTRAAVATAFSATALSKEPQGGMWASGGPAVDAQGFVHAVTGASVQVPLKMLGLPGIFPDSEHNWGQSVIRLRDDPRGGFELAGTYTPFNYAEAQAMDIDLASSSATLIDLDPTTTATPQLLVVGGKQGNVYLVNRAHMPGSLVKRPPISNDSRTDGSLLAPDTQPQFGQRGPINVFGPYADKNAMNDQARSRTTAAHFRSAAGKNYVFVTGSAKTGPKLDQSTPPGLVRLEIVTSPGEPAYLRIDQREETHVFHNPGSPVVTSNGGRDAIVWVLDTNAPRSAPMQGPKAARPVLYAFDALTFELLWKNDPGELATTGKYNEATVVRGLAIVGTDRIQVFGRLAPSPAARPVFPSLFDTATMTQPHVAADPGLAQSGKAIFDVRCAMCHNSGQPGIPTRDMISRLDTDRIVNALRNGIMKPQSIGLADADFGAIAAYLTTLPVTTTAPATTATLKINLSGRALYVRHCIACHMPDGCGMPPLQPALQGNPVVRGDPAALIQAVLRGSAKSAPLANATHAYGPKLSDAAAADLLTYVRQAFGQSDSDLQPAQIAEQRRP